jgi:uncharacterized protein (TIGR02466 family)
MAMGEALPAGQRAIQRSAVLQLFPTLLWRAELHSEVRERIQRGVLAELEASGAPLRDPGPGRSWQSSQTLHRLDALAELVSAISHLATAALEFMHVGHQGFEITGCWANVNAPGAAHAPHHHPNNFLSGSYYVTTPPAADTIQFHDPRPQTRIIRPPVRELSNENTDQVVVRVQPGTLLLFPAWLEHSVAPNRSDQLRISLSFNLMFSRYTELMSPPMWDP